jgi:hypothetical protein
MKVLVTLSFTAIFFLSSITGSAQACTLNCPSNMVIKADSSREGARVTLPVATTPGDCGTVSYAPVSGSFFRIGSHSIIVTTSTGQKCYYTLTVTDNESPLLSVLTLSSDRLWPATNQMRKIAVYYTVSDNAEEVSSVLSVSSNDTMSNERDWEIVNNHSLLLKTSRLDNGEPRIYTITVTSSDLAGNTTTRTTSIAVSGTMTPVVSQKI